MLEQISHAIVRDFGLSLPVAGISEAQLEEALAERVYQLLQSNPEQLFAVLYRLDVEERLVHVALLGGTEIPANIAIARLIIARQRQKAETRQRYNQDQEGDGSW